jgi:hypothetical protein
MDTCVQRALEADVKALTPDQLDSWVKSHGWIDHPTAQPRTLRAWRAPQRPGKDADVAISLPTSMSDRWYASMAASLIGQVALHADLTLVQALRELEVA